MRRSEPPSRRLAHLDIYGQKQRTGRMAFGDSGVALFPAFRPGIGSSYIVFRFVSRFRGYRRNSTRATSPPGGADGAPGASKFRFSATGALFRRCRNALPRPTALRVSRRAPQEERVETSNKIVYRRVQPRMSWIRRTVTASFQIGCYHIHWRNGWVRRRYFRPEGWKLFLHPDSAFAFQGNKTFFHLGSSLTVMRAHL